MDQTQAANDSSFISERTGMGVMFAPSKGSTRSNAVDFPINRDARDAVMNFMVLHFLVSEVNERVIASSEWEIACCVLRVDVFVPAGSIPYIHR